MILALVLMLVVVVSGIYILTHVGKTVKEYKKQSAALSKVEAELEEEQAKRDKQIEEKAQMELDDGAIVEIREEVFKDAAQLEKDIKAGKNKAKICYLTFDDGPYYRGKTILKILDKYDVKATFFLTTANGDRLPDKAELSAASMYPEYLRYGHTIGNHTYSHDYGEGGIYKNANAFMKDMKKQENFTIKATGGYDPKIVRFPGGRATAGKKLEDIEAELRKGGYSWVDWTVDSSDSWGKGKTSPETIMKQVKEAAKDQKVMVILCHEWSKDTQKALPEMIEYLQGEGYIFLPMFPERSTVLK